MVYTIRELVGSADCATVDGLGRWVRSIPVPHYGGYLWSALAVLRGRAVAVRYPIAGELEQALHDTGGLSVEPNQGLQ